MTKESYFPEWSSFDEVGGRYVLAVCNGSLTGTQERFSDLSIEASFRFRRGSNSNVGCGAYAWKVPDIGTGNYDVAGIGKITQRRRTIAECTVVRIRDMDLIALCGKSGKYIGTHNPPQFLSDDVIDVAFRMMPTPAGWIDLTKPNRETA